MVVNNFSYKITCKKCLIIILLMLSINFGGCIGENKTPTKDISSPFFFEEYMIRDAVYSPDGKFIVFSSKMDGGDYFDIWMMSYDGNNLTQITFDDYDQIQPSMSREGNIVFSAYDKLKDSWNLWEYSLKSKIKRQLTNDIFNQTFPTYSPDGSKIIYSSNEGLPKYTAFEGVRILRRIWILDLGDMSRKLLYDSDQNCFHPSTIDNTDKVMFSYEYHTEPWDIFGHDHLKLYIVNMNGTLNREIDINESNIYYSHSIDENNIIFSIYYRDYGQCIGLYNLDTNNMTILLANCNYSIEQLSYSPFDNTILINCIKNDTVFLRKLAYDPVDNNGNGFADNIEDFKDRDPTAPMPIHHKHHKETTEKEQDSNTKKDSDKKDVLCFGLEILLLIILILLLVIIAKKPKQPKKKNKEESEVVEAIILDE